MNNEELISKIADITRKIWQEEKKPLLISNIPRYLVDIDFRSILGEEGVKSFVSKTCVDGGYKLVVDPIHKARVGIIPSGENYEFQTNSKQPVLDEKHKGEIMLKFLNLLNELSEEERRSVVIPVNVIAKLLQK